MTRFAYLTFAATGALALSACASNEPDELPPTPAPAATATPAPTGGNTGGMTAQQMFESAVNGQNVIYFDTDSYSIDGEDQAALQSQAAYLQANPGLRVTLEGHCDERGTREYNLALGERRANAAKNYLVALGIPATRITTVSYGKERPVALASTPQAWAQNRRAVTMVVN